MLILSVIQSLCQVFTFGVDHRFVDWCQSYRFAMYSYNSEITRDKHHIYILFVKVRMCATQMIGRWLLELPDRYSFFYKFIPLILTSFNDEMPDIRLVLYAV